MTDRVRDTAFDLLRVTVFHGDRARNVAIVIAIVIGTRNAGELDSEFLCPLRRLTLRCVPLLWSGTRCSKYAHDDDANDRDDEHQFRERESSDVGFAGHFV